MAKRQTPWGQGNAERKGFYTTVYTNTKKIARKGRLVTESRKRGRYMQYTMWQI